MWSELIKTMSFFPFANSSNDLLPIGLSIDLSTVSCSERGFEKFSASDSNNPAKFLSGMLAVIICLS